MELENLKNSKNLPRPFFRPMYMQAPIHLVTQWLWRPKVTDPAELEFLNSLWGLGTGEE